MSIICHNGQVGSAESSIHFPTKFIGLRFRRGAVIHNIQLEHLGLGIIFQDALFADGWRVLLG